MVVIHAGEIAYHDVGGCGPEAQSDITRVAELCLRLLRREQAGTYGDFDEEVKRDFALVSVSDEEFDDAAAG